MRPYSSTIACLLPWASAPIALSSSDFFAPLSLTINFDIHYCKTLYLQGWELQERGLGQAALTTFQKLLMVSQELHHTGLMQAARNAIQLLWPTTLVPQGDADMRAIAPLNALLDQAQILEGQSQLRPALTLYEQALQQATCLDHPVYIGRCLNHIGAIYAQWQQYSQTELYCRAAAHILADTEAVMLRAEALNNWGLAHYYQGHSAAALDCFQQALSSWEDSSDTLTVARTLDYLGRLYAQNREYWLALGSFEAAADILCELADEAAVSLAIGAVLEQTAEVCIATQHLDVAIAYLQAAYDNYALTCEMAPQITLLYRLGACHHWLGQTAIARHYYRVACH